MKLKHFLCLTVCLTLLFAPFLLDISQNGKTYAFSSRSGNNLSGTGGDSNTFGYTLTTEDPPNNDPVRVPEPATWLLVGAGAAIMAAFRKKFRNK
jgi:hypothetical protein